MPFRGRIVVGMNLNGVATTDIPAARMSNHMDRGLIADPRRRRGRPPGVQERSAPGHRAPTSSHAVIAELAHVAAVRVS
jgi:hypothetical protein